MKTQGLRKEWLIALIAGSIILSLYVLGWNSQAAHASSTPGLGATVSSSTQETVGTTAGIVAATSTYTCAARIISTQNSPIMLQFSQFQGGAPTGGAGLWQAASTTVAYDSGLYGCNAISAYSYATQNIQVVVTQ